MPRRNRRRSIRQRQAWEQLRREQELAELEDRLHRERGWRRGRPTAEDDASDQRPAETAGTTEQS
jgi:hypothetical protein